MVFVVFGVRPRLRFYTETELNNRLNRTPGNSLRRSSFIASRPTRPPRPTRGHARAPHAVTPPTRVSRSRGLARRLAQTRRRPLVTRPVARFRFTGNPRATSRPQAERRGAAAALAELGDALDGPRRSHTAPVQSSAAPPRKARAEERRRACPLWTAGGQPEQVAARSRAKGGWQHPPEVLRQDNGGYDGAVFLCKFRKLDRASILHF